MIKKQKTFLLAEAAQSYEGDFQVLVKLAELSCMTGIDGFMFQIINADEIAIPSYEHYSLFKSLELSEENWKMVVKTIQNKGVKAVAEVFDMHSVNLMVDLNIDAFKIHAADIANLGFLTHVGGFGLPVFLGVGGSDENEIQQAIDALKNHSDKLEIVLMHGYQTCPTPIDQSHISKIKALKARFALKVGYSDHISGMKETYEHKNDLAVSLPLLAIGCGANVIEKHIMLDRSKDWEDNESALSVAEFPEFVKLMRSADLAMGDTNLDFTQAEKDYRVSARKCLVSETKIKKGQKISLSDIVFKRINHAEKGFVNSCDVVNKVAKQDISDNMPIYQGMIL